MVDAFFSHKTGPSLNLKLMNSAGLAGQQAPGIGLSALKLQVHATTAGVHADAGGHATTAGVHVDAGGHATTAGVHVDAETHT